MSNEQGSLQTGSCFRRGVLTRVLRGAQEIIEWLANPDAFQADALPKFVEEYDAVPYLLSALPIAAAVMAVQLAHELAHRAVAARRQVRAHCGSNVRV